MIKESHGRRLLEERSNQVTLGTLQGKASSVSAHLPNFDVLVGLMNKYVMKLPIVA